jgi:hypothetical protein
MITLRPSRETFKRFSAMAVLTVLTLSVLRVAASFMVKNRGGFALIETPVLAPDVSSTDSVCFSIHLFYSDGKSVGGRILCDEDYC